MSAAPTGESNPQRDVKSLLAGELETELRARGEPAFRAGQILKWLYAQRVETWAQMSNIPARLRAALAAEFTLRTLACVRKTGSADTTRKFLWRLHDYRLIESVLIPANPALYGEASDRHTLCVSTQVGCAYGCRFCASGLEGWTRNLAADEIVEQVLAVERWHAGESRTARSEGRTESGASSGADATGSAGVPGESDPNEVASGRGQSPPRLIDNLVIMGMGEPLANYDALLRALTILNAPWGGGIGARKITVSTSGLVPQIRRLATEPFQFELAISLHGATDEVRNQIMPVNRKHPLAELMEACEFYVQAKRRLLTFEYILIAGVNDALDQAPALAALAHRVSAKVNLIPYNRVEGLPWQRPSEDQQERFLQALQKRGAKATLRREKGHDIDAACGQLRLRTEQELRHAGPSAA